MTGMPNDISGRVSVLICHSFDLSTYRNLPFKHTAGLFVQMPRLALVQLDTKTCYQNMFRGGDGVGGGVWRQWKTILAIYEPRSKPVVNSILDCKLLSIPLREHLRTHKVFTKD